MQVQNQVADRCELVRDVCGPAKATSVGGREGGREGVGETGWELREA